MTLTCATSSHGTVSYRFLLNNKEVYHGSHNTYTVPNTATANSNSYTCKATISGAESVPSGEVKVKFVDKPSKPTLTSSSSNTLTDGGHMTLTCSSKTSSVTMFQFYKDGHLVSGNSKA